MRKSKENIIDLDFLRSNRMAFIKTIKPWIGKSVRYFVSKGYFSYEEVDDLEQEIILYMLEKSEHLFSSFHRSSTFKTYITAVIINKCKELYRRQDKKKIESFEKLTHQISSETQIPDIIMKDEFRKLSIYFSLTSHKQYKLHLCLKLLLNIPVTLPDFTTPFPSAHPAQIEPLINLFNHYENKLNDKEIYQYLTPLNNRHEGKEISSDALRRWVDLKLDELIAFMNGNPKTSFYDKETIRILLEKYYSK